jgi:hypothetical protein
MSDFDDNFFEEFEEEEPVVQPEAEESEGDSNKTFIIVAGALGGILLLAIVAFGVFLLFGNRGQEQAQQAALINAQNTATALAATQMAEMALTQSAVPAFTDTPVPTNTPVVLVPTEEPTATQEIGGAGADMMSRTQTVAALRTKAAGGDLTLTPDTATTETPTALPTTGFADEVGLPGLFGLGALLVGIIFIARRLRLSGNAAS